MTRASHRSVTTIQFIHSGPDVFAVGVSIVTSCLFVPWDQHAEMFVNGEFSHEEIRQTVASWLLFGKRDIYPMQLDAAEQLMRKATGRGCGNQSNTFSLRPQR